MTYVRQEEPTTAIFLNSKTCEIRDIIVDDYKDIQRYIGGHYCIAHVFDNGDTLMVDDEGLLKPHDKFVHVVGAHQPFAGNGVIVGPCDDEGEMLDCVGNAEYYKHRCQFLSLWEVRTMLDLDKYASEGFGA